MFQKLLKINERIDKIEDFIMTYLVIVMTSVIFLQVIMRYVFNNSLTWCEECSVICFMWLTWIGASNGVKKGTHIRILVIVNLLGKKMQNYIMLMIDLVWFIFTILLIRYGIGMVKLANEFNRTTPALNVPMAFNYLSVVLGGICMALGLAGIVITRLTTIYAKNIVKGE